MPVAAQGGTQAGTPAADCPASTAQENETVARRYLEEVLSQGNLDALDEIWAPDMAAEMSHHGVDGAQADSREARIQRIVSFHAAFDLSVTVEELLNDGDLVVVRSTNTGIHWGEFMGIPLTGQEVIWTGINVFRFECGFIAETWSESDRLSPVRQLEADAEPGTPESTPASSTDVTWPCPSSTSHSRRGQSAILSPAGILKPTSLFIDGRKGRDDSPRRSTGLGGCSLARCGGPEGFDMLIACFGGERVYQIRRPVRQGVRSIAPAHRTCVATVR